MVEGGGLVADEKMNSASLDFRRIFFLNGSKSGVDVELGFGDWKKNLEKTIFEGD